MAKFPKMIALLGALAALPGAAQAGTATDTKTAAFDVINQCSVTGATINLGTYRTNQTWGDVAAVLGSVATSFQATHIPQGPWDRSIWTLARLLAPQARPTTSKSSGPTPAPLHVF